jgi:hypothetical protein
MIPGQGEPSMAMSQSRKNAVSIEDSEPSTLTLTCIFVARMAEMTTSLQPFCNKISQHAFQANPLPRA